MPRSTNVCSSAAPQKRHRETGGTPCSAAAHRWLALLGHSYAVSIKRENDPSGFRGPRRALVRLKALLAVRLQAISLWRHGSTRRTTSQNTRCVTIRGCARAMRATRLSTSGQAGPASACSHISARDASDESQFCVSAASDEVARKLILSLEALIRMHKPGVRRSELRGQIDPDVGRDALRMITESAEWPWTYPNLLECDPQPEVHIAKRLLRRQEGPR